MPYIHYESFDKQTETRHIISIVDESRETAKRAARQSARTDSITGWGAFERNRNHGDNLSTESSDENDSMSLSIPSITELRRRASLLTPNLKYRTSELSLIAAYLGTNESHKSPLHVRRTLDEFYYSSLKHSELKARDQSQILFQEIAAKIQTRNKQLRHESRFNDFLETELNSMEKSTPDPDFWTAAEHEAKNQDESTKGEGMTPEGGNYPILMVDQLWMWIIGNGEALSFT
jgi:hypothetical protein